MAKLIINVIDAAMPRCVFYNNNIWVKARSPIIDIFLYPKKLPTSIQELPSLNGIYVHASQWNERGYLLPAFKWYLLA